MGIFQDWLLAWKQHVLMEAPLWNTAFPRWMEQAGPLLTHSVRTWVSSLRFTGWPRPRNSCGVGLTGRGHCTQGMCIKMGHSVKSGSTCTGHTSNTQCRVPSHGSKGVQQGSTYLTKPIKQVKKGVSRACTQTAPTFPLSTLRQDPVDGCCLQACSFWLDCLQVTKLCK